VRCADPSGNNAAVIGTGIGTAICPGVGMVIGAAIGAVATVAIIYYQQSTQKAQEDQLWINTLKSGRAHKRKRITR